MDLCSASFDDLPDVLVADILSRLPVKTIVQSTSVNKLWYSLIKNPSFISTHLSRFISDLSSYYVLVIHKSSLVATVVSHNHALIRHPNLNLPFETIADAAVIGTCNGLICLTDCGDLFQNYFGRDIYLVNPFIHKYKKLDVESSCYPDLICKIDGGNNGSILVSFGYSEADNDYKVFRILVRYDPTRRRCSVDPTGPCILLKKVEIYSLNTGKWKSMDALVDQVPIHCSPTFVNGCLYWLPETSDGPLICFDMKDQLFSKITLPTAYINLYTWCFHICEKNGSVALCTVDSESISPCKRFCLLVLEKDTNGQVEWKEFYYSTTETILSCCLGFSGCGRFIFMNRNHPNPRNFQWSLVAADLNNSFALEKLELGFSDVLFTSAVNVMESLVMFSD